MLHFRQTSAGTALVLFSLALFLPILNNIVLQTRAFPRVNRMLLHYWLPVTEVCCPEWSLRRAKILDTYDVNNTVKESLVSEFPLLYQGVNSLAPPSNTETYRKLLSKLLSNLCITCV